MRKSKQLGIWMDHSIAHLMDFNLDAITQTVIQAEYTHLEKTEDMTRSEQSMHTKEKQHLTAFFNKIGNIVLNYNSVILFGPTSAKAELYNHLKDDRRFSNIKIILKDADKMTENQQSAYVREYFTKQL